MIPKDHEKISVLIVSATGRLGSLITQKALRKSNLQVSVLVRDPSAAPELLEEVRQSGGKIITADLCDMNSLTNVTKGFHTVVSALGSNDEKAVVEGQISLIDDAVKHGVTRFMPSVYGVNYHNFTKEELERTPHINNKVKVINYLDSTPLKKIVVLNGLFMESFIAEENKRSGYWGEGDRKFDITSQEDTAAFTIAVVADPKQYGEFIISGDSLTYPEMIEVYNKARGTHRKVSKFGSLEDLETLYQAKLEEDVQKAQRLAITTILNNPRSAFKKDEVQNKIYPEVEFSNFEVFLSNNPDQKLSE